jgi:hypothetical protein
MRRLQLSQAVDINHFIYRFKSGRRCEHDNEMSQANDNQQQKKKKKKKKKKKTGSKKSTHTPRAALEARASTAVLDAIPRRDMASARSASSARASRDAATRGRWRLEWTKRDRIVNVEKITNKYIK